MGEFVLILLIGVYGGYTPTSILFPSQQACETAKSLALDAFKKHDRYATGVCVPRNSQ